MVRLEGASTQLLYAISSVILVIAVERENSLSSFLREGSRVVEKFPQVLLVFFLFNIYVYTFGY